MRGGYFFLTMPKTSERLRKPLPLSLLASTYHAALEPGPREIRYPTPVAAKAKMSSLNHVFECLPRIHVLVLVVHVPDAEGLIPEALEQIHHMLKLKRGMLGQRPTRTGDRVGGEEDEAGGARGGE